MEEEKRLLYVAMTRAKTELFLTWRRSVPIFSANTMKSVSRDRSRFLDALVATGGASKRTNVTKKSVPGRKLQGRTGRFSSRAAAHGVEHTRVRNASSTPRQFYKEQAVSRPLSPGKTSEFKGTTSVYGNRNRKSAVARAQESPRDRKSIPQRSFGQREGINSEPQRKRVGTPRQTQPVQHRQHSPMSPTDSRRSMQTESRCQTERDTPEKDSSNSSSRRRQVDSTWFFPVGSFVSHKSLGRGTVLTPPPRVKDGDELLVHVEFENGAKKCFSATGSDLDPVF